MMAISHNNTTSMTSSSLPLAVDMDGTLITTDALVEAAASLVKQNPIHLFNLVLWRLKGKAYAKHQIGRLSHTDRFAPTV
jgi:hypothetical protein